MIDIARIARRAALAACFVVSGTVGASAMTADQTAALGTISAKLRGVSTMDGDFVQFNPNGDKVEGKFYIARPGGVRFEYAKPSTLSVIADNRSVLVFDKKLQTYDVWPLSQTPLRLLLDTDLDLASSAKVSEVKLDPDLVQVTLLDDAKFNGGTLTLVFDRASSELRQWTVRDQQDLETTVALYNVALGDKLSPKLFAIDYNAAARANADKRQSQK